MPTKTKMLDYGDFVYSPGLPVNEEFLAYLKCADRLLAKWYQAKAAWEGSPFSAELATRKRELDGELSDFVAPLGSMYTIGSVEQNPAFLRVSRFFADYQPIREPFSILHCSLDIPLHTVLEFRCDADLRPLNAALAGRTPFQWWQSGPMDRPCYLFGDWVWEVKPSESTASEEGLSLLFIEAVEKDQTRHQRLRHGFSKAAGILTMEPLSKEVKTVVWRRDRGRCAKCGSYDQLDFELVVPQSRGGRSTAENIQLLCRRCSR